MPPAGLQPPSGAVVDASTAFVALNLLAIGRHVWPHRRRAGRASCVKEPVVKAVAIQHNANTNTCRTRRHKIKHIVLSFGSNISDPVIGVLPRQPNPNVYGTNTPTEVSSEATAFWGSTWHRWGCNDPTARHSVIGGSKYRYIGPAGQRSPGC